MHPQASAPLPLNLNIVKKMHGTVAGTGTSQSPKHKNTRYFAMWIHLYFSMGVDSTVKVGTCVKQFEDS